MKHSLSLHSVLGHLLPGAVFLLALLFLMYGSKLDLTAPLENIPEISASVVGAFLLIAWFIGLVFDAIRNSIVDPLWDKCWKCVGGSDAESKGIIDWKDVFFKGEKQKIKNVSDNYYTYYVNDVNLCVANIFLLLSMAFIFKTSICLMLIPVILAAIFFHDACSLRKESIRLVLEYLRELNDLDGKELPHYEVYTRLAPSRIHGVGIFAIRDIKKDTAIFYGDDPHMEWVEKDRLGDLPSEIMKLYEDFAVLKDGKYGCPKNFNLMTVSWYLNNSKTPNVRCGDDYQFYALRDVMKGEELTADYDTYSESHKS